MDGVMFYFSGTGNSKHIACQFAEIMKSKYGEEWAVFSIEDEFDANNLMREARLIGFCYPIYGSAVPCILRQFVLRYRALLANKQLVIFCTQYGFSGDGARVFTDLLRGIQSEVVLAEHFCMPNNICNVWFFPVKNGDALHKVIDRAERRLRKACRALAEGKSKRRGFNPFSHLLGLIQRPAFLGMEAAAMKKVFVDDRLCTRCGRCVRECPTHNLFLGETGIQSRGACTICYRCVNRCPNKAITVGWNWKVIEQYHGINRDDQNGKGESV